MDITIYSTSSCAACNALESWLEKLGHKYTKKITDTDEVAMSEFMDLNEGYIGVPFTVIRDKDGDVIDKISGFEPKRFKAVFDEV